MCLMSLKTRTAQFYSSIKPKRQLASSEEFQGFIWTPEHVNYSTFDFIIPKNVSKTERISRKPWTLLRINQTVEEAELMSGVDHVDWRKEKSS